MESNNKILTVSDVANQIEAVITDYLSPVYVEGEVSNYYRSGAGHIYFSLKDDKALINAIIWSYQANNINFQIKDGMRVVVYGEVVTYKLRSQYQIRVMSIRASGLGNLYQQFEKLKYKLEAEGLFDPDHKMPIPKFPAKIGLITSPTSAAVRDIIQVSGRRNPSVQLVVYPAVVQGDQAAQTIIDGIQYFNDQKKSIDLIIISRGGGSIEDLWAFNEEPVVRAIYKSELPIVTGIGHEIDFTLSDFAADYRAPTPSAAAEESIPDLQKILEHFEQIKHRMGNSILNKTKTMQREVSGLDRHMNLLNPVNTINNQIQHVDELTRHLIFLIHNKFKETKNKVDYLLANLNTLNPEAILDRGFALVMGDDDKIVKSIKNIREKDKLKIKLSDGIINTTVDSKTKK